MQDAPVSVKIALLGNSGVGKTSIIQRYTSNIFAPGLMSTTGASYSNKIVHLNDTILQLDLWDTAGQEKYRSLGRNFYRDAYIIILVYDITRKESLEGLKEIWYPDLQKFGEKYNILAVVGNKSDLYEKEEVNEDEARAFANEIKADFDTVSAKNGNNIDNLFGRLINKYYEPIFQTKVSESTSKKGKTSKINNSKNKAKNKKKWC